MYHLILNWSELMRLCSRSTGVHDQRQRKADRPWEPDMD